MNDNDDKPTDALGRLLGELAAMPTPEITTTPEESFEAMRANIAAQIQADVADLIGHQYPIETVLAAFDGATQMAAHAEQQIAEGKVAAVRIQGPGGVLEVPVGLSCAPGKQPLPPSKILDALLSRLVLSPSTVLVLGAHGYGMTLTAKKPKSRLVIEH